MYKINKLQGHIIGHREYSQYFIKKKKTGHFKMPTMWSTNFSCKWENIFKLAQARARREGEFLLLFFMQLEMWSYDRTQKFIMTKVLSFTFLLFLLFPLVGPHSQEMLSHQVATRARCLYVPWHPSTWRKAGKCLFIICLAKVPGQARIGPSRSHDFLWTNPCDQSHDTVPAAGD